MQTSLSTPQSYTCVGDQGRVRAEAWLAQNFARIGSRSSVDLTELFGDRTIG